MNEEEIYPPCSRDGERVTIKGGNRPVAQKHKGQAGTIQGQETMSWGLLVKLDAGEEVGFFPDELGPA